MNLDDLIHALEELRETFGGDTPVEVQHQPAYPLKAPVTGVTCALDIASATIDRVRRQARLGDSAPVVGNTVARREEQTRSEPNQNGAILMIPETVAATWRYMLVKPAASGFGMYDAGAEWFDYGPAEPGESFDTILALLRSEAGGVAITLEAEHADSIIGRIQNFPAPDATVIRITDLDDPANLVREVWWLASVADDANFRAQDVLTLEWITDGIRAELYRSEQGDPLAAFQHVIELLINAGEVWWLASSEKFVWHEGDISVRNP